MREQSFSPPTEAMGRASDADIAAEVDNAFSNLESKATDADVERAFANITPAETGPMEKINEMIRQTRLAENGHKSGEFPVVSEAILKNLEGYGLSKGSSPADVATALDLQKMMQLHLAERLVQEAAEDRDLEMPKKSYEYHRSNVDYDIHVKEITPGEYFLQIAAKEVKVYSKKRPARAMIGRTFRLDNIKNKEDRDAYLEQLTSAFNTEANLAESPEDLGDQVDMMLGNREIGVLQPETEPLAEAPYYDPKSRAA